MKIYVNRIPKQEPYGGGNQFLSSFIDHMTSRQHHIVYSLEQDIDVILVLDPRPAEPQGVGITEMLAYKAIFPKVKIVHRVNECDSRKNTNFIDEILMETMKRSDVVVFISEWLQRQFVNRVAGYKGVSHVIYNGCDTKHFSPSFKTPGEKLKLVTHHWSDNWMKGFDIYTEIDKYLMNHDEFEFTYVGRYYNGYSPKKTRIINPLWGKNLGDELKKHDVYVTASKNEPCGMHHIEAAACGLPVLYHTSCGGINELAEKHGVEYKDFQDFLAKMKDVRDNIEKLRSRINYDYLSVTRCCLEYEKLIESVVNDNMSSK